MKCPRTTCGNTTSFHISGSVYALLNIVDGKVEVVQDGEPFYDDETSIYCRVCGMTGTVRRFSVEQKKAKE